ncbi:SusC/RagA family TonB-linked outer membrane protein [Maribacter sp. 2304DJ31-5]|uniref:SusC/RagA family TonB-linked outer membrane protein n=1 Tax=Maribacter sp. 2304DJ31-5 TaxID=3386273 RepID=UPI0039BD8EF9
MKNELENVFTSRGKNQFIRYVMKAFIFLCCTTVFSFTSNNVLSQNSKIVIDADQTLTVDQVFDLIMTQTEYNFIYEEGIFNNFPLVYVKKGRIRTNKLLQESLGNENLNVIVTTNNTILIREKSKRDKAIQQVVSGKIVDEAGLPVPGVTVLLKGTNLGVASDFDGNYSIRVPNPENVLVFSALGFKNVEVTVKNQTVINVTMVEDAAELEEVVLTGYQKIAKERATGAFEKIDDKILEQRITTNLIDRLEGFVPGLTVNQDNEIVIRGQSTLFGNRAPLIVVDGFPIEGDISTINPTDIKSITVLKDAAAASIWGSRAANGVVVVVTKQAGKSSGTEISASTYVTIGERGDFKDLQLMNAEQAVDMERQYTESLSANSHSFVPFRPYQSQSTYYEVFLRNYFFNNPNPAFPANLSYTDAQANDAYAQLASNDGYGQINKYLYRSPVQKQYNISLSSGGEKNQFFGSIVYNSDEASAVGNDSDRVIVNLKNDFQINNWLAMQLGANVTFDSSTNNAPLDLSPTNAVSLRQNRPYDNIVDANGNRIQRAQIGFFELANKEAEGYLPYTTNLLDVLENNDNTSTGLATRFNIGFEVDILDGLKFIPRFQYERNFSKNLDHRKLSNPEWRKVVNDLTTIEANGSLNYNVPFGDALATTKSDSDSWTARAMFSYDKTFNEGLHKVNAIAGLERRKVSFFGSTHTILGYDENALTSALYDLEGLATASLRGWHRRLLYRGPSLLPTRFESQGREISYFGNMAYTYANKYTVSGSARLDKANVFGVTKDAKNNVLWSVGGSWNISNEDFIANRNWIDNLKLRATYGVNGNRPPLGLTSFLTGSSGINPFTQINAISLTNPANPSLRAEKVFTTNVGLDYALFNNRVRGSIDVYNRKTEDAIGPLDLDPTNGFPRTFVNYAELSNKGIEFAVNITPIQSDDFSWDLGAVFSYNENEVTRMDIAPSTFTQILNPYGRDINSFGGGGIPIVGQPVGRLYAYRWGGLDNEGQPQIIDGDGNTIGWKEAQARGFDESLIDFKGTSIAPYFGSLSNTFRYKDFSLGIIFNYKFGHKMRHAVARSSNSVYNAQFSNTHRRVADRWRQPGDEATTDVPAFLGAFNLDMLRNWIYYGAADINVLDAGYVRLSDVNLDYALPTTVAEKIGMKGINVKFQAKNLWLYTKNDEDIDPEANFNGSLNLPRAKSFIFGINANF